MIKEIIKDIHNPLLRSNTLYVTAFDGGLEETVNDLIDTCKASGGVGLAMPQIGGSQKMFVVREDDWYRVFINPTLEYLGEPIDFEEGCLSVPGVRITKKRSSKVKVTYDLVTGESKTESFGGLTAVIIQHEYDHLEGKLIIDGSDDFKCPVCGILHTNPKSRICSKECFMVLKNKNKISR